MTLREDMLLMVDESTSLGLTHSDPTKMEEDEEDEEPTKMEKVLGHQISRTVKSHCRRERQNGDDRISRDSRGIARNVLLSERFQFDGVGPIRCSQFVA